MPQLAKYLILWAIAPPVVACITYALIRGWSFLVSGGKAPESVIRREWLEFKLMIVGFYLIGLVVGFVKGVL